MKKTLLGLVALALTAGVAAAQTSVSPLALRSYGDQGNGGAIFAVDAADPLGDPACGALTTIVGAAYTGTVSTFDLIGDGIAPEDNFIHDMQAVAVFSADDLLPGGDATAVADTEYSLDLTDMDNFGISYKLSITTVPDPVIREVLMALGAPRGPFGAGFSRPQHLMTVARPDRTRGIIAESDLVPFAPVITSQSIPLAPRKASGAASADSASTNSFAEAVADALTQEPITTCRTSCAGGDPNVNCDVVINHPLALAVSADDGQTARYQQWMIRQGFLFGFVDNILVLGGDPTEPSNITISF